MTRRDKALLTISFVFVAAVLSIGIWRSINRNTALTIGAILPLTGATADYGEEARSALQLLAEEVNTGGGLNGRPLQFAYQDDEMNAAGAQRAYRVLQPDVAAIVGPLAGHAALAIIDQLARDEKVVVSPTASSPELSGKSRFFFRVWPPDGIEGDAVARFIRQQLGAAKVAVLAEQTDFGKAVSKLFEERFHALGGTVVFSEQFPTDMRDFRTAIRKAADQAAEVLYAPAYYASTALILQQMKAVAPTIRVVGASPSEDIKLIELAQASAEGFTFVRPKRSESALNPLAVKFDFAFERKFRKSPGAAARFTYDAGQVIVIAIRAVGANGSEISGYLRTQMRPYLGVTGEILFDANGDIKREFEPIIIKNGKFDRYL